MDNFLQALAQATVNFTLHVNLTQVYEDTSKEVLLGVTLAIAVVLAAMVASVRLWTVMLARQRRRHNALAVKIADQAPVDDGDEHEFERHGDTRTAAPGDSDFEEDSLAGPATRKKGKH